MLGLTCRTLGALEPNLDWRVFRLSSILRSQSNSLKSLLSLEIRPMIIHRQNRAMTICLVAIFFVHPLLAFAQRPAAPQEVKYSPQLISEIKKVQQAALESDYAYRQLAHLSNNIGPRLSGSPQAQTAVEYVAAELRKLGLDVQLEKVMVPHWVRGEETGALTDYSGMAPGTTQKIVLTALGGSMATPNEGLTAEVVVVNNFDELTALGRDRVAGKIVLFNAKFDQQLADNGFAGQAYGQAVAYRGGGPSAAARLGAGPGLNRFWGGAEYRLAEH